MGDGIAMLLPGPSSKLGGVTLLVMGAAWLVIGVPRLLSRAGKPFSASLVARFGLVAVPPLAVVIAGFWRVTSPHALNGWFAVAWFGVWLGCLGLSAFLPCPKCGQPFGRLGLRLEITASACPHCGANPRGDTT